MPDATFACPDLTTFARLDHLTACDEDWCRILSVTVK